MRQIARKRENGDDAGREVLGNIHTTSILRIVSQRCPCDIEDWEDRPHNADGEPSIVNEWDNHFWISGVDLPNHADQRVLRLIEREELDAVAEGSPNLP